MKQIVLGIVALVVTLSAWAETPSFISGTKFFIDTIHVGFVSCDPPFSPCGGVGDLPEAPAGYAVVVHRYYAEADPCLVPATIKFYGFNSEPGPLDGLSVVHTATFRDQPHGWPYAQFENTNIWLVGIDQPPLPWHPKVQINTERPPVLDPPAPPCSGNVGEVTIVYSLRPITLASG